MNALDSKLEMTMAMKMRIVWTTQGSLKERNKVAATAIQSPSSLSSYHTKDETYRIKL